MGWKIGEEAGEDERDGRLGRRQRKIREEAGEDDWVED